VLLQGYPQELLPITATGIPSMHICLDFIPELLSQPSLEKQIFAMDLVSHLAVQYALPKSLSVARLAINTLSTLLGGKFLHEIVSQLQDYAMSICLFIMCFSECLSWFIIYSVLLPDYYTIHPSSFRVV
jgi:hypothetical protein